MTRGKKFKKRVREEMARTGEPYTACVRRLQKEYRELALSETPQKPEIEEPHHG